MKVFNLSLLIATTCVGLTCHTSVASTQDRSERLSILNELNARYLNCKNILLDLKSYNKAIIEYKKDAIDLLLNPEHLNQQKQNRINYWYPYAFCTLNEFRNALENARNNGKKHEAIYLEAKIDSLIMEQKRSNFVQSVNKEIATEQKWITALLSNAPDEEANSYKMKWKKFMQQYNRAIADLPDFDMELIKQYCKNLKSKIINKRLTKGIKHKNIHVAPKTANKIKEIKIPLSKLNNNKRNITSSSGDKKPVTTYISKKIYKNEGMKTRCAQKNEITNESLEKLNSSNEDVNKRENINTNQKIRNKIKEIKIYYSKTNNNKNTVPYTHKQTRCTCISENYHVINGFDKKLLYDFSKKLSELEKMNALVDTLNTKNTNILQSITNKGFCVTTEDLQRVIGKMSAYGPFQFNEQNIIRAANELKIACSKLDRNISKYQNNDIYYRKWLHAQQKELNDMTISLFCLACKNNLFCTQDNRKTLLQECVKYMNKIKEQSPSIANNFLISALKQRYEKAKQGPLSLTAIVCESSESRKQQLHKTLGKKATINLINAIAAHKTLPLPPIATIKLNPVAKTAVPTYINGFYNSFSNVSTGLNSAKKKLYRRPYNKIIVFSNK